MQLLFPRTKRPGCRSTVSMIRRESSGTGVAFGLGSNLASGHSANTDANSNVFGNATPGAAARTGAEIGIGAGAEAVPTTARPYRTRERLYYETDYLKSELQSSSTPIAAGTSLFEPALRKSDAESGAVPLSALSTSELPPLASLHDLLPEPLVGSNNTARLDLPIETHPASASSASVTVFGFTPSLRTELLGVFSGLGPVETLHPDSGASNWFHLTYADVWAAQRALARNGSIHCGVMIGVLPMDRAVAELDVAAQSFMSPVKRPDAYDAKRDIFRKAVPTVSGSGMTQTLPGDDNLVTKAVNYMFGW